MLVLGAVDLGRAFYESIAIQNAAEAGSLTAIDYTRNGGGPGTGDAAIKSAIKSSTNPNLFPNIVINDSDITLNVLWQPDSPYTITVTHNFRIMTPLMGRFIGGGQDLTLRAVAQGRQNCSGGC